MLAAMARPPGSTQPPTLPVQQGRKPRGPNQDNLDLVQMGMEALRRAGGVDFLEEQARKRPKDFLAFLCRLAPLQIRADIANLEVVVHALAVNPQPTPGVLSSPIAGNVVAFVRANAPEAARYAQRQLLEDDGTPNH